MNELKSPFYVPTIHADSWRALLADPEKHWRESYSAHSMAHSWEGAKGFPKAIKKALHSLNLELCFGFPEFKVHLDTPRAPSQNDLWILARDEKELWSIAVEGKVHEDFGPLVSDWLAVKKSEGRKERLAFLLNTLGIKAKVDQFSDQRYQLFHRTASAILMAERVHAQKALMVVHSFEKDDSKDHFVDFEKFVKAVFPTLGPIQRNQLSGSISVNGKIELRLVWVQEELPIIRDTSKTNDEIPSDIDGRFGKAVNDFEKNFKADSYTQSYPFFLDFIRGKEITKELLIPAIHMIYGWMPRVFRFGDWSLLESVLKNLNKARTATPLGESELETLSAFLNNSMVGTSKLLHFINPDVYPIWDSKICSIFFQKKPFDHRMKNVGNYITYQKWIRDKVAGEEFNTIYDEVNTKLNTLLPEYENDKISKVRAAELILFSASKSR